MKNKEFKDSFKDTLNFANKNYIKLSICSAVVPCVSSLLFPKIVHKIVKIFAFILCLFLILSVFVNFQNFYQIKGDNENDSYDLGSQTNTESKNNEETDVTKNVKTDVKENVKTDVKENVKTEIIYSHESDLNMITGNYYKP